MIPVNPEEVIGALATAQHLYNTGFRAGSIASELGLEYRLRFADIFKIRNIDNSEKTFGISPSILTSYLMLSRELNCMKAEP